jgi:hypothetical protein
MDVTMVVVISGAAVPPRKSIEYVSALCGLLMEAKKVTGKISDVQKQTSIVDGSGEASQKTTQKRETD